MYFLSLIGLFLLVFIPFWLMGKAMKWLGKHGQAWCQNQMELRGIDPEETPKPRRRPSYLRLVP
tara:strand:+ start:2926 stop:3117 length:192 start_codon:yes stop_codon:yes gene_type:complete